MSEDVVNTHNGMRRRDDEVRQLVACTYLAIIVVDARASVKLSFWDGTIGEEAKTLLCGEGSRLRPEVEEIVLTLITEMGKSHSTERLVVLIDQDRAVRLSPLTGGDEALFALIVERDRNRNVMFRAASRYQLTRRQNEVLRLVLEGASAGEIACILSISEYTARGYVKSLLSKTASRNRAAMVAKVLEWHERPEGFHRVLDQAAPVAPSIQLLCPSP